ncbi:MAG: aldehyde dehydrogenase family protein, partial [Clostridia bacterium]
IYYEPYGSVLIMSPWNYPFQLAIAPLVGAIAAGNCAVIKLSNYSPNTSTVIEKILRVFADEYIAVVQGDIAETTELLEQKFDYILFTGSPTVGKIVMEKASKHLTPVTLELGGKSPCIIDETANINLSAKRIVWGKLLNAGQTCVAPDYLLVQESVKAELLSAINYYIKEFYGENPETNTEYPKIINEKHFNRLCSLIPKDLLKINAKTLQIAPTVLPNSNWNSEIMKEEIFGPILPVLAFRDTKEVIQELNKREKPLALYLFTRDKNTEKEILSKVFFGGGCVNDTIIHVSNDNLPFGGIGNSGMGKYHGDDSFYSFSHTKSIMKKSNKLDINIRYAPFGNKIKLLRKIMK